FPVDRSNRFRWYLDVEAVDCHSRDMLPEEPSEARLDLEVSDRDKRRNIDALPVSDREVDAFDSKGREKVKVQVGDLDLAIEAFSECSDRSVSQDRRRIRNDARRGSNDGGNDRGTTSNRKKVSASRRFENAGGEGHQGCPPRIPASSVPQGETL